MCGVIIFNNNRLYRNSYVNRINVRFRQTVNGLSPIYYVHQSNAIVMKNRLDEKYTTLRFSYVSDHHGHRLSASVFFNSEKSNPCTINLNENSYGAKTSIHHLAGNLFKTRLNAEPKTMSWKNSFSAHRPHTPRGPYPTLSDHKSKK